jgi:hypothetical protein
VGLTGPNRRRVDAGIAGRPGDARRRVVWPLNLAGMLAVPGPVKESSIAGVHLPLTQTFPTPAA